jgi:Fe-S-cluster-containing dehydrogenase component/anaerobic selenocysteine-containing dehydrogenase
MSRGPDKKYWRNLAAWSRDSASPNRQRDESSPSEGPFPMDRRRFFALLGASAALGTTACGVPADRGEILPYVDQPEGNPAGSPRYYASTLLGYPGAPPVLVTTREGRPIKLEGNPQHPASQGALDAWGQSATLSLYDPDRLKTPMHKATEVRWEEADAGICGALSQAVREDKQILLFTPPLSSSTARQLVDQFIRAYPTVTHLPITTFHAEEAIAGQLEALGTEDRFSVDWDRADVILSLEADFLGPVGTPGEQRQFAERRLPEPGPMNRLWCIEGSMSATGAFADHRLPLRPGLQGKLLLYLLREVEKRRGTDLADSAFLATVDISPEELGIDIHILQALVEDLSSHPGRSVVLVGDRLPASAHSLSWALNASLDNLGTSLTPTGAPRPRVALSAELFAAVEAMRAGEIAVAIDLGANPAFVLPSDLHVADVLSQIPTVVSSCLVPDETTALAHWALPATHDLESWGDTDLHPGTLSLQQPALAPLFQARQSEESLLRWLPQPTDRPSTYRAYLENRWRQQIHAQLPVASSFSEFWTAALHDGFISLPGSADPVPSLRLEGVRRAVAAAMTVSTPAIDLILSPSYHLYDGRFANSGWLQEMPHPITSHVWGNGAFLGLAMAEKLEVEDGDLIEVTVEDRTVTLPVILAPGTADGLVQIDLGYGRAHAGSVGSGIGVDASTLRISYGGISPWIYAGVSLERAAGKGFLVRTQEHRNIEGRNLIVEGTEEEYRKRPDFVAAVAGRDASPSPGDWEYATGQKWGMVIDLSACTGCNGCLISCDAENNIPVVGPEQISRGREMHWIRADRYYRGDPHRAEEVQLIHQPILCQHCDNAPCENVCPVAATTHSTDGLNEMTYNRCVGTRYCANNCPYKVRRFNYLANHQDLESPRELAFNPEVTVRSRGVMEKCTFCVQRLRDAQRTAKREGRPLRDGEAQTACQQACPTHAISFGDLNDPDSRVAGMAASQRGYHLLAELGVRPAITYLARIRNPHPDLKA